MPARAAHHPRADLRAHPTNGMFLVARDLDDPTKAWSWFRGENGWADRSSWPPERVDELEPLPPSEGFRSGWPGAQPLIEVTAAGTTAALREPRPARDPAPPRRAARDEVLRAKFTVDEANRVIAAAAAAGETISGWLRRVVLASLDAPPPDAEASP